MGFGSFNVSQRFLAIPVADVVAVTRALHFLSIVYSILIFIFALVNNIKDVEQGRPFIRHKTV